MTLKAIQSVLSGYGDIHDQNKFLGQIIEVYQ